MKNPRKLLKIATAGSVDDGKSTLIGRLLYETESLPSDRLEAIRATSKRLGFDYLDFSLATDGLTAEREQGITIDVAHIYFNTPRTNFIIADTPGHFEYTRNMVTGASTSEVAIVLIDARKGVTEQTRRHLYIAALLRLRHVVVAVNKMDLTAYDRDRFSEVSAEALALCAAAGIDDRRVSVVPISAREGDNVTAASANMPWYTGAPLLETLERLAAEEREHTGPFRFSVQTVIRPKTDAYHDFRGFAGMVKGASVSVGDEVVVLPSGMRSRVKTINVFDRQYAEAAPGSSVVLELDDEVNLSRGELLVKAGEEPTASSVLEARVCHMNRKALGVGSRFLLQQGSQRVLARVDAVLDRVADDFSGSVAATALELNAIGRIRLKLAKPLYTDRYADHKANGAFILIDEQTNDTATVGVVV